MDQALVAALLIGWAAVLLPSAVRSRRTPDPDVTIGGFTQAMSVLRGRPQGRQIMVPSAPRRPVGHDGTPARSRARSRPQHRDRTARRRAVLVRLLLLTAVSLPAAVVVGGLVWVVFGVVAAVLLAYMMLLRHFAIQGQPSHRRTDVAVRPWQDDRGWGDDGPADALADEGALERHPWQPPVQQDDLWEPHSNVRVRRWEA